jgi:hypothetical protein
MKIQKLKQQSLYLTSGFNMAAVARAFSHSQSLYAIKLLQQLLCWAQRLNICSVEGN